MLDLGFVVLVEVDIAVADKVVALDACRPGGLAVVPFLPSEHRFADVYAAVVDDVGLDDAVAAGFEYLREAVAEEYVAQMAEV